MFTRSRKNLGWWQANGTSPARGEKAVLEAISDINRPFYIVDDNGSYAIGEGGTVSLGKTPPKSGLPIAGYIPAFEPDNLGDSSFCADLGIAYPYIAGGMANGICSVEIVEEMGKNGMLGFFGAAGLSPEKIESAIKRLSRSPEAFPFGFNLIHNPNEPDQEEAIVALYLKHGVRLVEAAAYLDLTLPVVRYRVSGIHRDEQGNIVTPNHLIAKVSRIEVASKFFAPPPERFLRVLVAQGDITEEQAKLAARIPMARDVTAEADSGGHTDNRPAITLIPTMTALRDQMQAQYGYQQKPRVGAAGGISTPSSAAAMFSMGAAYVVTGTVNQACAESGTSDIVREMLANTTQAEITMAPSADMFERGVRVQVLKHGTMFPMRAAKLYELYRAYDSLDTIPARERGILEKTVFRGPLEKIWEETREFFLNRDPRQVTRAEKDAKHKMALVFRWYLGQSSHWANTGDPSRKIDYQIWCGPAMGAFNEWVKGTFLEDYKNRGVVTVALNLLYGAAVYMRLNALSCQGLQFFSTLPGVKPRGLEEIREYLSC